MKRISLIYILMMFSFHVFSQDFEYVNQSEMQGSARTLGLACSQSAIGADLGAIATNPANLAMFRRSEISITPFINVMTKQSTFLGSDIKQNNAETSFRNFGMAFSTTDDSKENGVKGYTLGLVYNRLQTFGQYDAYSGYNSDNSYTTFLGDVSTELIAKNPDNLNINGAIPEIINLAQFGWKSQLTDIDANGNFVGKADDGNIFQHVIKSSQGYNTNWDISAGININDFLYLGASIKINQYELFEELSITEEDIDSLVPNFERFKYEKTYSSIGGGQGFSFGTIVRPTDFWRIGMSYQSAVEYELTSNETHILSDVDLVEGEDLKLLKSYKFQKPEETFIESRAPEINIGNYIQFNKKGFWVSDFSYSQTKKYSSENSDYLNRIRFSNGFEYRNDRIRYRAGFGIQNKFMDSNNKGWLPFWSLGGGYRNQYVFADMAFSMSRNQIKYSPYELLNGNEPEIDTKVSNKNISFTLGVRF